MGPFVCFLWRFFSFLGRSWMELFFCRSFSVRLSGNVGEEVWLFEVCVDGECVHIRFRKLSVSSKDMLKMLAANG